MLEYIGHAAVRVALLALNLHFRSISDVSRCVTAVDVDIFEIVFVVLEGDLKLVFRESLQPLKHVIFGAALAVNIKFRLSDCHRINECLTLRAAILKGVLPALLEQQSELLIANLSAVVLVKVVKHQLDIFERNLEAQLFNGLRKFV
jgi:hypothetical protein